ncbi:MAG: hypothetical protein ACM3WS_07100 [Bacillota bacterium]
MEIFEADVAIVGAEAALPLRAVQRLHQLHAVLCGLPQYGLGSECIRKRF